MNIFNQISAKYRSSGALMRLVMVNVGVFLAIRLAAIVLYFAGISSAMMLSWIEVPSSAAMLLRRPWTVFTYMVAHYDLLHILFNMLWLYWMGRLFMEYFRAKQLVALYVMGGLGGAAIYVLGYALLPVLGGQLAFLIGASASVIAIVAAMAVYAPQYRVNLFFLGPVSLKWLALGAVVLMVLSTDPTQMGGQLSHLGGALVGALYGWQMRRGHDITAWLNRLFDAVANLAKPRPRKKGVGNPVGGKAYHYQQSSQQERAKQPSHAAPTEAEIDVILDKLKRSGYAALTEDEKATLFRASGKK
ncbi:MAG: rhomboid family intramembrane serine protease [Bacteroidales bacterium]|nr:rhomboid family intramembrane serine protease [Bacteroidales bacterium]